MKILKAPTQFKTLNRIKLSPQFRIILFNYELQRKLTKRKVKENPLLESLKMQLTKDESDKDYFLREMRVERKVGEEMKNMYGAKAFEGTSGREIKLAEKKVSSEKKITKMFILEGNPLLASRNKSNFYESNNNSKNYNYTDVNVSDIINDDNDFYNNYNYYTDVHRNKNYISLPLIFPRRRPQNIKKRNIFNNNISGINVNDVSYEKSNFNSKDYSRSISSISNNYYNVNNVSNLSTKTLLDNLDSVRNSYRNVSRNIGRFVKNEKEIYENTNFRYKMVLNQFE